MIERFAALSSKLFGPPPENGALRSERLRYIRRLNLRMLPAVVPCYAVVFLLGTPTWVVIVTAAAALLWIESVISLTIRIRREERREGT